VLAGQDAAGHRRTLEQIVSRSPGDLDNEGWLEGPGRIVAAIAVVAAGLPFGEAIAREIAGHGHDTAAIVVPADPVLADDALAALVIAAGLDPGPEYDGAWHHQWDDQETALRARQATDELAGVFRRYRHRHDQELPLQW
jgi:hypothetical protein